MGSCVPNFVPVSRIERIYTYGFLTVETSVGHTFPCSDGQSLQRDSVSLIFDVFRSGEMVSVISLTCSSSLSVISSSSSSSAFPAICLGFTIFGEIFLFLLLLFLLVMMVVVFAGLVFFCCRHSLA